MRDLWRKLRGFVFTFFAIVGFFDLVGRSVLVFLTGTFFGFAVTKPLLYDKILSVLSADQNEKAVLYVSSPSGSGCNEILSVVANDTSDQIAWQERNWVFTTSCGDQLQFSWEPPSQGRVKPRLRINAEAASGDFMRRFALGGSVAIAYRGDP